LTFCWTTGYFGPRFKFESRYWFWFYKFCIFWTFINKTICLIKRDLVLKMFINKPTMDYYSTIRSFGQKLKIMSKFFAGTLVKKASFKIFFATNIRILIILFTKNLIFHFFVLQSWSPLSSLRLIWVEQKFWNIILEHF